MLRRYRSRSPGAAALMVSGLVFVVSRSASPIIVSGLGHVVPILIVARHGQPGILHLMTGLGIVLIATDGVLDAQSGADINVLVNHVLTMFFVFVAGRIFVSHQRSDAPAAITNDDPDRAQRTAEIVEASSDAIVTIDASGRVVQWNRKAERVFGWSRDAVVGSELATLMIPERYRAAFVQGMANLRTSGTGPSLRRRLELTAIRRDGAEFAVELTVKPTLRRDGVPEYSAFIRELKDRPRLESRMERAIHVLPVGVVIVDGSGRITLANAATEALFGYTRTELVGHNIDLLVPEHIRSDHSHWRSKYMTHPQSRQMGGGRAVTGRRRDGTEVPLEISLRPITTGRETFILAAIADVSQRQQAEAELKRKTEGLEARNDEMQQFAYTISHDLKSPLVTITGFSQALRDDLASGHTDRLADSVLRIDRAAEQMTQLLDDLMTLSKVGRVRNDPDWINVDQLVQSVVEGLSSRIRACGAVVEIMPNLPAIHADHVRLRQVIENLLTNAIKYGTSADDPKISIGGFKLDNQVLLYVRDNGQGIRREDQRRVFGVFERLQPDLEGTGLGLAVVKRIARIHGGRVWVESEPAQGASFWFAVPAEPKGDWDDSEQRFRLESDSTVN